MLEEDVDAALTGTVTEVFILQEVPKNLGEVRFSRAKEPRYPHSHNVAGAATLAQGFADLGWPRAHSEKIRSPCRGDVLVRGS
jgi:hypothetical protein